MILNKSPRTVLKENPFMALWYAPWIALFIWQFFILPTSVIGFVAGAFMAAAFIPVFNTVWLGWAVCTPIFLLLYFVLNFGLAYSGFFAMLALLLVSPIQMLITEQNRKRLREAAGQ